MYKISIANHSHTCGVKGIISPSNFQNLGKIIVFLSSNKEQFGQNAIKKCGKIRNFRAVTRTEKFFVPNAEKCL